MSERHQPYELGRYHCNNQHHALLHYVLDSMSFHGYQEAGEPRVALEFGVGNGDSLRCISTRLSVIGFDSFLGLPEDWRPGYERGMFAADYQEVLANTPEHCLLVPGLFEETLPDFYWEGMRRVGLIHIDCDLYSSTKTVLDNLSRRMLGRDKPFIIFDEWYGYPSAEDYEQRAWREFADRTGIEWDVVGCGVQQWGIRLR